MVCCLALEFHLSSHGCTHISKLPAVQKRPLMQLAAEFQRKKLGAHRLDPWGTTRHASACVECIFCKEPAKCILDEAFLSQY